MRVVLILGIILVIVGGVGFVFGLVDVPLQVVNTVSSASHPDASKLCKSGETLATEEGPEEYDVVQHLYDNSVDFYCVNDAGVRRDVTDQVGQGVVTGILGSFGSVLIPVLSCGLCIIGAILAVMGGFVSRRRALRTAFLGPNMSASFNTVIPSIPPQDDELSLKLRQLEEAHQANLISEDEYQRKRQQLLDAMK